MQIFCMWSKCSFVGIFFFFECEVNVPLCGFFCVCVCSLVSRFVLHVEFLLCRLFLFSLFFTAVHSFTLFGIFDILLQTSSLNLAFEYNG